LSDQERVFNTFRRKPYRPFYSLREFQTGVVIFLILGAVTLWVVWRGAHPDPDLFATHDNLLTAKGGQVPVYKRPLEQWVEPGGAARTESLPTTSPVEPFPAAVLSDGWKAAGPVQSFDETNLYKKIDGRETFYKSYGFKKLDFLSLESTSNKDLTIDMELFDLGSIENALGALSAELSDPKTPVDLESSGLSYFTSNGAFVSQGRYYIRLVGSEDQDAIREKVRLLKEALTAHFPGEKLPWTYALFVGQLGTSPGQIRYQGEDAFSFSFAKDVYSATIPGSEQTELFITKQSTPQDAEKLTKQFAEGFGSYDKSVNAPAGHPEVVLFQNEMINTYDGVTRHENFVLGIRFAGSPEEAIRWMEKLKSALKKIG
jgi:hypothetical protein